MVVFGTIAAISVGMLVVYFEVQEMRQAPGDEAEVEAPRERLLVLPTTAPAQIQMDAEALDTMPHLAALLDEAKHTGSAAASDPLVIDTIWFQLNDAYDVPFRVPVVVGYDGGAYRVQATD